MNESFQSSGGCSLFLFVIACSGKALSPTFCLDGALFIAETKTLEYLNAATLARSMCDVVITIGGIYRFYDCGCQLT